MALATDILSLHRAASSAATWPKKIAQDAPGIAGGLGRWLLPFPNCYFLVDSHNHFGFKNTDRKEVRMGEILSPSEVTARYVSKMGGTIGESFAILHNHVAWLYSKWFDYKDLYDSVPRIDLMNATAGPFFHDLQIMLHESILLHMRRLADPKKVAKKNSHYP